MENFNQFLASQEKQAENPAIARINAAIADIEPRLEETQKKLVTLYESGLPKNDQQSPEEIELRQEVQALDYEIQKLKDDKEFLIQDETDFIEKPQ